MPYCAVQQADSAPIQRPPIQFRIVRGKICLPSKQFCSCVSFREVGGECIVHDGQVPGYRPGSVSVGCAGRLGRRRAEAFSSLYTSDIGLDVILSGLLAACFLGALLGIDREILSRPAGLRPYVLVSLAAATSRPSRPAWRFWPRAPSSRPVGRCMA